MQRHEVRVYPSGSPLAREAQLAWKLAVVATDRVALPRETVAMLINRMIDNAAVAIAAINRRPVVVARDMALGHARKTGGTIFGVGASRRVSPEWAAWANGTAVRELDMHDSFLAADCAHPGDTIPPILAVAQSMDRSGRDLLRGLATGYELQIALVRAISLRQFGKDPIAHLCPAQAGGIGSLMGLKQEVVFQAIQQAVHVSFSTRQSRKGERSSWQAYAPAHAGKLAVEAVDRAMRGEAAPSPVYEGEDGVLAWMLGGAADSYTVELPAPGEPKRAILDSFAREHGGDTHSQALIDLAFRLRDRLADLAAIDNIVIHTSQHAPMSIGADDPRTFDPQANRATLARSLKYVFTVALQDGAWHPVDSFAPQRAARPDTAALWHKITTREDPAERAFGGRVEITLSDGSVVSDEIAVANAHPLGSRPFARADYIRKFHSLTAGLVNPREVNRFLDVVQDAAKLKAGELHLLNVALPSVRLAAGKAGIF